VEKARRIKTDFSLDDIGHPFTAGNHRDIADDAHDRIMVLQQARYYFVEGNFQDDWKARKWDEYDTQNVQYMLECEMVQAGQRALQAKGMKWKFLAYFARDILARIESVISGGKSITAHPVGWALEDQKAQQLIKITDNLNWEKAVNVDVEDLFPQSDGCVISMVCCTQQTLAT
jgi:hypothetical protein